VGSLILKQKRMASPQKENGYTAIANELLEALAMIRIPGEARQLLDVILRKTYGFNKSEDAISLSQFVLKTGLKKNAVCKGLNKLKKLNLITQKVNDIANTYRFNKDFSTWKPLPKKGTSTPKGERGVPQKVNKRTPKGDIQKTVLKDTITKDISEHSSQVQELFNFFYKNINPNINFANKTDRQAAEWLINKYSYEKVLAATRYALSVQSQKYAPTITTPYQLKEKMAALIKFKESKKGKIWKSTTSALRPFQQEAK